MVSSVLSPEKVIGRQNTNKAATQNFISGGSVVGASVVNGAANKIVGFQRTGARPAPSATGSIVSTISTNINNNVTNTINKTLQGFSADYQKRIKQVDDAKPIGVLGKFLNVYKTALGFINFFGNKRNIDKVRDNLEALKKSFTESFEVAKLIRQVIIKIVKQLSNLPVASPSGGGGLNLDVDIPGGGLKKSAPRGLQRMMGGGKGKMLALGAGALGLGAAGAGAVNALSDSPQDQAQAAQTTPDIPGDVVDKFSSIVDRFANVISKLFNMKNEKSKGSSGSAGGGGRSGSPGSPGSPPPGGMPNYTGSAPVADVSKDTEFLAEVHKLAGETGTTPSELMSMYNAESKLDPKARNKSGATGLFQLMYGGQFGDVRYGKTRDEFSASSRADQVRAHRQYLTDAGFFKKGGKGLLDVKTANIAPDFLGKPSDTPMYRRGSAEYEGNKNVDIMYGNNDGVLDANDYAAFVKKTGQEEQFRKYNDPSYATTKPAPGVGGPETPDFMLPPEKRKQYQNLATNVSQPPPSQQQQQPIVMPINLGGGGQKQSGGGSSGGGGGGSQGSGPSVPFLPAGNPDNFLVLYSRMVYNIVDG